MTLRDWIEQYQRVVHLLPGETGWLPDYIGPGRAELWHLTDYIVSSVCGGSIWLIRS